MTTYTHISGINSFSKIERIKCGSGETITIEEYMDDKMWWKEWLGMAYPTIIAYAVDGLNREEYVPAAHLYVESNWRKRKQSIFAERLNKIVYEEYVKYDPYTPINRKKS